MRIGAPDMIVLTRDEPGHREHVAVVRIVCHADRHDTIAAVKNHGCSCPHGTALVSGYEKRRRHGLTAVEDSRPTRDRLRNLMVNGWALPLIATRTGLTYPSLRAIVLGRTDTTRSTTARLVETVAARLAAVPGPSDQARRYAQRHGWHRQQQSYEWLADVTRVMREEAAS